jgi:hypothetical protein
LQKLFSAGRLPSIESRAKAMAIKEKDATHDHRHARPSG